MGNCIVTRAPWQAKEQQLEEEGGGKGDGEAEKGPPGGGLKVKVVLTRRELERLLMELDETRKGQLEDVLVEMATRDQKVTRAKSWRPKLESIVETSEAQES